MLGAPGSGKGTQAKKLMNDKGISHISTGDMLRSAVEEGTQLGLEARDVMESGKLLNVYFSSPEELAECENLGGELIKREDDNENTIRNRLDVYKEKTEPLISYYENENLLKRVNAEGSMEEVYKGLLAAIYTNAS